MRDIGDYLRLYTSRNHKKWYQYVPEMEANMNNTVHTGTNVIPEMCVHGKVTKWPFGEEILQATALKQDDMDNRIKQHFEKKKQREDHSNEEQHAS